MTFLNAILLAGAAGIAVPIIIHLLNKRKFQRVQWAAMRFLRASVEQNQRRIQIEDLLLLILRCVLVALIAFTLARPVIPPSGAAAAVGNSPVMAVIVVDNSYSMSGTDGVKSRFDLARDAARQIIDSFPAGSSVAIYLASDTCDPVIAEPTADMEIARRVLRESPRSDRPTNLAVAIDEAVKMLARKPAVRKEIFVVTDGQASGVREQSIKAALEPVKNDIRTTFIQVGSPIAENLAVVRVAFDDLLPVANRPLAFVAEVRNFSRTTAATNVRVALRVNSEPYPAADGTIESIPPGESRTVRLAATLKADAGRTAYHTVTAYLTTPDRLPADDSRTLAIRAITTLKFLVVDGNPGRQLSDSESFHILSALRASSAIADTLAQVSVVTSTELVGQRLDEYDFVFMLDVPDFAPQTLGSMQSALQRGVTFLFFMGDNVQPGFYNQKLLTELAILPASLGDKLGDSQQQEKFFSLQGPPFSHPIASKWNDANAGSPADANVYRSYVLTPDGRTSASLGGGSLPENSPLRNAGVPRVVLNYADTAANGPLAKTPAVIERTWGQGRVFLFASTASTRWNNLPAKLPATNLVLIFDTLREVLRTRDQSLNITAGRPFTFRDPNLAPNRDVLIRNPRLAAKEPGDARKTDLDGTLPTIRYRDTQFAGSYDAVVSGEQQYLIRFAAQQDVRESEVDEVTGAQVGALKDLGTWTRWSPGMPLAQTLDQARIGAELFFPLAVLLAVFAVSEMFLAHWFSRSK